MKRTARRGAQPPCTIRPLTQETWPALEDLFGPLGACNGCWCMYWRIGSEYKRRDRAANREAFRQIVEHGPSPGLLAFDGDRAIGWLQLTPREELPWLERTWRLRRLDDEPVWSISCLYVRIGYRRRGVSTALVRAAIEAARAAGAQVLEAYPLDAELTPSASGTGFLPSFVASGFEVAARHAPPRPIVRLRLNPVCGDPQSTCKGS